MAAGASPIIGDLPAGPSLRYDPEFEAIEAEVRRIESEGPNAVRWQQVAPEAIAFVQNRSKDLLVAAYGSFALWRQEGVRGAAVGLTIIDGMIEAHWAGL
ncbi:MAG: type VI secretion system protein TssA, partial [Rhodospirillales bacterium]|nr:type VI secretion system protein TssA [Rhodospirillales bacterium]